MAVDLSTIKALTFDVGRTIFDWHHTIREEIEQLAQGRGCGNGLRGFHE